MFLSWRKWMKLHLHPSRFGPRKPFRANICRPRVEPLESRFLPATFTVSTHLDSGVGSLRDAIMKVNLDPNPGTDIINFAIGSGERTIALRSALPTITHPVIIDGTTQRGFSGKPLIELDGSGAGSAANGLTISAGGSTVLGLVINRFGQDGIRLESNGGDTIKGNYIGTNVSGKKAFGNGASGVEVRGGLSNIIIGGTTAGARNLISGNGGDGITIFASMCLVEGNYIGTDVTGTQALGNSTGISMTFPDSNTIGGATAGAGNLISANRGAGIFALFGANNIVQGNRIGTDVSGTRALGNAGGVSLASENNDIIGGATPGAGNLISANQGNAISLFNGTTGTVVQGNTIGTDVTGTEALGNGGHGLLLSGAVSGSVVGGASAAARNLISGNQGDGILINAASSGNLLEGNYIGTDVSGTLALGNAGNGVEISSINFGGFGAPANNTIGSPIAGGGNLISGNGKDGVFLNDFQDSRLSGTVIQGNLIGTDVTGSAAVGNGANGLEVFGGANHTTVGGASAGAGNVISGNKADGIFIQGDLSGVDPFSNAFLGNFIGTDLTGAKALGNGGDGIDILGGFNNTIGGTVEGAGNVISANAADGVFLGVGPNGNSPQGNTFLGNKIGTDITGTVPLGNGGNGVEINTNLRGSATVGGTSAGAGNLISANARDGIHIFRSVGIQVLGNQIGTTATGSDALPNVGAGVFVDFSFNLTIGGQAAGAGNTIAFNLGAGVFVNSGTGNLISGNSVFSNGALGIDLNQANGANNSQPAPVLNSAALFSGTTTVQGTLTAAPNTTYTIEFFANAVCDPSGFGEGQTFLGSITVTTDDTGMATFTASLSGVLSGQFITATATDPLNDTSEFSDCLAVTG